MKIDTIFKFNIGERVRLISHNVEGVVNGLWIVREGVFYYNVEYKNTDGHIEDRNFFESEIAELLT